MATLEEVQNALREYVNDSLFVFAACENSIAVLKKLDNTITNESASYVVDKNYAILKGNKFYVEKIIDVTTLEELNEASESSKQDNPKTYISKHIVEEKDFDFKLSLTNLFAKGIKHYLTIESAYYSAKSPDGLHKIWRYDGQLCAIQNYKNGKLNGKCVNWIEFGMKEEEYYKDGKRDGQYEAFYHGGQKFIECEYKNDKLEGKFKEWYDSDQIKLECTYKDGNRDGIYREWHENGQKIMECHYKDGKLDGKCQQWTPSGDKYVTCIYKNNKKDKQKLKFD